MIVIINNLSLYSRNNQFFSPDVMLISWYNSFLSRIMYISVRIYLLIGVFKATLRWNIAFYSWWLLQEGLLNPYRSIRKMRLTVSRTFVLSINILDSTHSRSILISLLWTQFRRITPSPPHNLPRSTMSLLCHLRCIRRAGSGRSLP